MTVSWRELALLGAGCLAGCGSTVEVVPEVVPPLPPGVAPPELGCSEPLPVPTGKAWVGEYYVYADGSVGVPPCPYADALRLVVPAFYLDAAPVTNGCYARCVEDGACAPPGPPASPLVPAPWDDVALSTYPLIADAERAEAFCAWRGGRLASWAELVRAEQAEDAAPCRATALSLWVGCAIQYFEPPECAPLLEEPLPYGPVRSDPGDIGPFGHADLMGGGLVWTATVGGDLCLFADDSLDPVSFGPSSLPLVFAPRYRLWRDMWPASGVGADVFPWMFGTILALDGSADDMTILRCAYDPAG